MISVEQALEKILSYVDILEEEERPILDCLGQVLAEDIYSSIDIPPLDNTAMDGYAVQSGDTRNASRSLLGFCLLLIRSLLALFLNVN